MKLQCNKEGDRRFCNAYSITGKKKDSNGLNGGLLSWHKQLLSTKIAETANFSNNHRNTSNTKFDVCTESQAVTVIKTPQYWYKDKNTDK